MEQEDPYVNQMPGEYPEKLTPFDKLILVKVMRPELLQQTMSKFLIADLGQYFIEPPATNMEIMYRDLATHIPMIFVLS